MAGRGTPRPGCQAEPPTLRCAGSPPARGRRACAAGPGRQGELAAAAPAQARARHAGGGGSSFDQLLMSLEPRDLQDTSVCRYKLLYSGSKKLRSRRGFLKPHVHIFEARRGEDAPLPITLSILGCQTPARGNWPILTLPCQTLSTLGTQHRLEEEQKDLEVTLSKVSGEDRGLNSLPPGLHGNWNQTISHNAGYSGRQTPPASVTEWEDARMGTCWHRRVEAWLGLWPKASSSSACFLVRQK